MEINFQGFTKCAVCNEEHEVEAEELKPMVGIKEACESISALKAIITKLSVAPQTLEDKQELYPPCLKHSNSASKHWCCNCREAICDECIDSEHENCSLRRIKPYMKSLVAESLDVLAYIGANQNNIETNLDILEKEIAKLTTQKREYEQEVDRMQFLR